MREHIDLRKKADEVFIKYPLPEDKAGHSKAVAECAWKIANRMKSTGMAVDPDAAYAGALLHDIGIVRSPLKTEADEQETPWPEHAVEGAKIALREGLSELIAGAIQSHELLGFTRPEIEELGLSPPAVGDTWRYDSLESKTVACADQIVYIVRHMGLNPWEDENSIVRANFDYVNTLYKKRTGHGVTKDHPILKRMLDWTEEILPYARPEDIPPAWKGISTFEPTI